MRDVFRPTVRAVPLDLRGSMDPAEIYHELLEHRWYLSEQAQHDIGLDTAVEDYVTNILPKMRESSCHRRWTPQRPREAVPERRRAFVHTIEGDTVLLGVGDVWHRPPLQRGPSF